VRRQESHVVALPQPDAQQPDLAHEVDRLLLPERGRGLAGLGGGSEGGEGCGGERGGGVSSGPEKDRTGQASRMNDLPCSTLNIP